jgi:predicted Zn-dependent peptidase
MYSKNDATKDLLKLGFLLEEDKLQDYYKTNKIISSKVGSGPLIFSIQRNVEDSEQVYVDMTYAFGAYFEPDKIRGITHLTEHLWFSEEFNKKFVDNQVNKNGKTGSRILSMEASGVWNLNFPDFSLPSVLELAVDNFYNHPNLSDLEKIKKEVEVVLREIREFETNFFKYSIREVYLKHFLPEHELCTNILGTAESLESITTKDLIEYTSKRYDPNNSFIKIFVEGNENKTEYITSKFKEISEKVIKNTKFEQIPEIKEYSFENTKFEGSDIFEVNLGEKFKDKVIYMIASPYKLKISDEESFHFSTFESRFAEELFIKIRKAGIAYSSNCWSLRVNNETILFGAYFISTKEVYKPLTSQFLEIYKNILLDFSTNHELWKNEINNEILRISANPISKSTILEDLSEGIMEWGHPINSEYRREICKSMTPKKFMDLSTKLLELNIKQSIIGDI